MWYDYLLFLLETVTLVFAILFVLSAAIGLIAKARGQQQDGQLTVSYLNAELQDEVEGLTKAMSKAQIKARKPKGLRAKLAVLRQLRAQAKARQAQASQAAEAERPAEAPERTFVLRFDGDIEASALEDLREEVTAILQIAKPEQDCVVVVLESPGGVVTGYGLAAAQLVRLREFGLHVTVAVDKVAASGGYMMAAVANRIVAAPFAIVGSIGVVATVPNIHRLLKRNDIDIEQHTSGKFKRTLSLLGENTDEGRNKFRLELEEAHQLFKQFLKSQRENLDLDKLATGEHWFGEQAIKLGLIDEISTSDDLILASIRESDVFEIGYQRKKRPLLSRLRLAVRNALARPELP